MTAAERWDLVFTVRDILAEVYGSADFSSGSYVTTQKSSPGDLVTSLDIELELEIADRLRIALPGSGLITEEAGGDLESRPTWVVDPIDGTTNIVHGLEHAAGSVALLEAGRTTIGVVHNIFTSDTYCAIADEGAFFIRGSKRKPLSVSETSRLMDALLSFGLPYDRALTERMFATAQRVFGECQDLRRRGSAALDLVAVATGELDGHFELDLRLWDVAAAGLVVTEAGGSLSTWDGDPVRWVGGDEKTTILAAAPGLHMELLSLLSR